MTQSSQKKSKSNTWESILSNNPADHMKSRCKSARKAFYALRSAGLCQNVVDPCTIAHIHNVAIKPVLTYGCAAVGLTDKHVTELEKIQGSLMKTAIEILQKYKSDESDGN